MFPQSASGCTSTSTAASTSRASGTSMCAGVASLFKACSGLSSASGPGLLVTVTDGQCLHQCVPGYWQGCCTSTSTRASASRSCTRTSIVTYMCVTLAADYNGSGTVAIQLVRCQIVLKLALVGELVATAQT